MSNFSDIFANVRKNLRQTGIRYARVATTSAGAADGTTVISTNLTGLDDAWNYCNCEVLGGDFADQVQRVEDYTASTGTLTFTNNAFIGQIASGVNIELTEPGAWQAARLRQHILDAAYWVLENAPRSELLNYKIEAEQGITVDAATGRGEADFPSDMLVCRGLHSPFADAPRIKEDGKTVFIIPHRDQQMLENSYNVGYMSASGGNWMGFYAGRDATADTVGRLMVYPPVANTVVFSYVPIPTFDANGAWKVPQSMWPKIEKIAAAFALTANDLEEKARPWLDLYGISMQAKEK